MKQHLKPDQLNLSEQQESSDPLVKFTSIPILSSNYVWLVRRKNSNEVYVVDPGRADEAIDFIETHGLKPKGILITHSHHDHIGGIDDFKKRYDVPVCGPKCSSIPQVTLCFGDKDKLELWPGVSATIMHLPGHLPEHIAYFIQTEGHAPSLLCGDVLFSSGCGRMFTGPAATFQASLARIAALPPETEIYCAHEYTQSNIEFAKHIEPSNLDLERKASHVAKRIGDGGCSLPTTVREELLTNPFLRTNHPDVIAKIEKLTGERPNDEAESFAALRRLKDAF